MERPAKDRACTAPFQLTIEQAAAIETRYAELAQPAEFDGIRTQIARELSIPKAVVKRVVKEYRERLRLPSWWDAERTPLEPEQAEEVRRRYVPLLPLPPIGVHTTIAEALGYSRWSVYDAIGKIREELGLTRYNEREETPPTDSATPWLAEAQSSHADDHVA